MSSHVNEKQRVYQDGSQYHLPKDAPEQERLEKQSQSIVALMNHQPFHAPLSSTRKILDVGCGTGAMTHLLASKYPEAQVYGVDLALVQSDSHKNIQNVEYVQGDIRELIGVDPRFETGTFDYIFQRLFIFVSLKDWSNYVATIARLLKPGGWMEFQEPSMRLRSSAEEPFGDSMWWYSKFKVDTDEMGMDVEIGDHLYDIFQSEPILENVEQSIYPFNAVPEEARPELHALQKQIPQLFALMTRKVCGEKRGEEEAEKISNDMKSTWEKGFEKGVHFNNFAVTGQRK